MSAIKVEVLGTGCKKCQQLEANAKEAIAALNLDAELVHIKDPMQIVERGVMKTPALMINDTLVSEGKVATPEQIKTYLG